MVGITGPGVHGSITLSGFGIIQPEGERLCTRRCVQGACASLLAGPMRIKCLNLSACLLVYLDERFDDIVESFTENMICALRILTIRVLDLSDGDWMICFLRK